MSTATICAQEMKTCIGESLNPWHATERWLWFKGDNTVRKDRAGAAKAGLDAGPRYRAPALEKGLDILELITRADEPMTVAAITQKLGRSTGELFRMIQVLEFRGFIKQTSGGGYLLTNKLFSLGMEQAPTKGVIEAALPVMRDISDRTEQSCHLAVRTGGEIVVVARMEAAGLIGFSVRLGYRQLIPATASGTVLYAFQSSDVRARWEEDFAARIDAPTLDRFRRRADKVARQGHDRRPSDFVGGIIDISAPVLRNEAAAASLSMPFVDRVSPKVALDDALKLIVDAAVNISSELASSDARV